MRRFLASLISNSEKAIQTRGIGGFATYLDISLLLSLNTLSILLFTPGNPIVTKGKISTGSFGVYVPCSVISFFILIAVIHPWKKVRDIKVTRKDEIKNGWIFFGYALLTCAILIMAMEYSRKIH